MSDEASYAAFRIAAAGATIAVRRAGAGPAIVCLHATGHGARDFDRLAQRLGAAFQIIALDWPGHGDSPPEDLPASAARYARILEAALDGLGVSCCVLLGNSIGGAAAILAAGRHPDRVRAVVLCNSGGLIPVAAPVRLFCRMTARRFERAAADPQAFRRWFTRYYQGVLPEPEAAWRRDEIVAAGLSAAPVLAQAWRSFARPEADIRAVAATLPMPVLFAWGRRDRILPWLLVRPAARRVPRAQVSLFDAGHAAFLERPEAFDAALAAFLEGVPA